MDSLQVLESLDVTSQGNIYIADYGNERFQKFDSHGNFLLKWGTSGSAVGQFDGPVGVALDSNDNDYITDVNSHRLQKFSGNGDFISTIGNGGDGD
jgi:DNA-binding beta-propeller fold protein YncE